MKTFMLGILLLTHFAFAGSGGGNGGGIIVYPDDTVTLSDQYISETFGDLETQDYQLPKPIKDQLILIKKLFNIYTTNLPNALYREQKNFMNETVFDPKVKYLLVEQIPEKCIPASHRELPKDSLHVQVMCTDGFTTIINKNFLPKLTIRQMALLLLHEALHRTSSSHKDIGIITVGMEVLLKHFNLQEISKKKLHLSDDEISKIEAMVDRVNYYSLTDCKEDILNNYRVTPQGGGLVHQLAGHHQESFIGIGSKLGERSKLERSASIQKVDCNFHTCTLDESAFIDGLLEQPSEGDSNILGLYHKNSYLFTRYLNKYDRIIHPYKNKNYNLLNLDLYDLYALTNPGNIRLGKGSSLKDLNYLNVVGYCRDSSDFNGSCCSEDFYLDVGMNSTISNSEFYSIKIIVKDNVKMNRTTSYGNNYHFNNFAYFAFLKIEDFVELENVGLPDAVNIQEHSKAKNANLLDYKVSIDSDFTLDGFLLCEDEQISSVEAKVNFPLDFGKRILTLGLGGALSNNHYFYTKTIRSNADVKYTCQKN